MADTVLLKRVTLTNGDEAEICDQAARERIEALENYTDYLGVTTTALTDGSTTNPITINGEAVTAKKGNIANYGSKEFIFNGTVWQEFGDLTALGALAFVDTAVVAGTAAAQTFTGTEATINSTLTGGDAQTVATGIGNATKANIKEFDQAGSVTSGTAAAFTQGTDSFTQGTDSFTQGTDSFAATVDANGVLSFTFTQGSDTFTQGTDTFSQGTDDFTANTPTAVTLPTSKETSVVTDQGAIQTSDITIPTGATATYTPAGTNAASNVTGTASAE